MTILQLEGDEEPKLPYGEREKDHYHNADGVVRSARKVPVDIPGNKVIASSRKKLDPKKQLQEAGYPFDHIGTELTALDGKIEVVSSDVMLLKNQFEKQTAELTNKIKEETGILSEKLEDIKQSLSEKLGDIKQSLLEHVNFLFTQKFVWVVGVLIASGTVIYGIFNFLETKNYSGTPIILFSVVISVAVLLVTFIITKTKK